MLPMLSRPLMLIVCARVSKACTLLITVDVRQPWPTVVDARPPKNRLTAGGRWLVDRETLITNCTLLLMSIASTKPSRSINLQLHNFVWHYSITRIMCNVLVCCTDHCIYTLYLYINPILSRARRRRQWLVRALTPGPIFIVSTYSGSACGESRCG